MNELATGRARVANFSSILSPSPRRFSRPRLFFSRRRDGSGRGTQVLGARDPERKSGKLFRLRRRKSSDDSTTLSRPSGERESEETPALSPRFRHRRAPLAVPKRTGSTGRPVAVVRERHENEEPRNSNQGEKSFCFNICEEIISSSASPKRCAERQTEYHSTRSSPSCRCTGGETRRSA